MPHLSPHQGVGDSTKGARLGEEYESQRLRKKQNKFTEYLSDNILAESIMKGKESLLWKENKYENSLLRSLHPS